MSRSLGGRPSSASRGARKSNEAFRAEMRNRSGSTRDLRKPIDGRSGRRLRAGWRTSPGRSTARRPTRAARQAPGGARSRSGGCNGNRLFTWQLPGDRRDRDRLYASGKLAAVARARGDRGRGSSSRSPPPATTSPGARELNDLLGTVFDGWSAGVPDRPLPRRGKSSLLVSFPLRQQPLQAGVEPRARGYSTVTVAEEIGVEGRGSSTKRPGCARHRRKPPDAAPLLTAMGPPISALGRQRPAAEGEGAPEPAAVAPSQVPDNVIRETSTRTGSMPRGQVLRGTAKSRTAADSDRDVLACVFVEQLALGSPSTCEPGSGSRGSEQVAVSIQERCRGLFPRAPDGIAERPRARDPAGRRDHAPLSRRSRGATILRDVAMDFRYGTAFGSNTPEAYERLLLDAMRGDDAATRRDEGRGKWAYIDHVFDAWAKDGNTPPPAAPRAGLVRPNRRTISSRVTGVAGGGREPGRARERAAAQRSAGPGDERDPRAARARGARDVGHRAGRSRDRRVCLVNLVVAVGSRGSGQVPPVVDEVTQGLRRARSSCAQGGRADQAAHRGSERCARRGERRSAPSAFLASTRAAASCARNWPRRGRDSSS